MLDRRQRQAVVEQVLRGFGSAAGLLDCGAWWVGPLATAYVLAYGRSAATIDFVRQLLAPLQTQLSGAPISSIPPAGREPLWDAVAAAEVLRVLSEHVLEIR
jgi:hypothetical protein